MIYCIVGAILVIINYHQSSGLCPLLGNPVYGYVEQSEEYAEYYCDESYELLGEPSRICKYGEWSGREPVCWDGIFLECIDLVDPRYGYIIYTNGLENGSMAQYSCQDGYTLFGKRKRQCINGYWEDTAPNCLKTSTSCAKIALLYGKVEFSNDVRIPGTNAIHKCADDKRLVGPNTRTCQRNGLWSGFSPVCEEVPKSSALVYNLKYCVLFSTMWTFWDLFD